MLSRIPSTLFRHASLSRYAILPMETVFSRFKTTAKKSVDPSTAKELALKNAIKQLETQFGKGSVMKLGSKEKLDIPVISTGSLTLDRALGIGGLPRGRVVEVYGPESSGKTTLALHAVAQLQKTGGTCTFIDAEHALDPVYASNIGVNIDDLYISQPDSGEQALEIADSLIRSGAMDMIVVDSVAALVPKAEAEGAMGDAHMALQARLMSQALRKLTGSLAKSNCLIIFINQIRQKVGILFGNPEVTPGGNALKFYSSIRMDIRRKTAIKKGEEVVGYETTVKVVKNKLAPPFRVASFDMMFGTGISHVGEVLDLALKEGLLEQSGAWISRNGENIAQGRAKAKAYLEENPEVCDELEKELRAKWKEEREATSTADMAAANNTDAWSSAGAVKEEENTVSEDAESV
ncbi:hypothetical protein WA538_003290, partial [Blastocystis sp. DL]